jgi:S-methylmethionine-dependent homocysteine/selenocysteine methylase
MKKDDIILLDGAMGTALRERGVKVASYKSSIWSAFAVMEAPEAIVKLHKDYILAGSRVITANNYSLTRPMLKREGVEDRLEKMLVTALGLANRARDEAQEEAGIEGVRIAASLPPLNTSYRADLVGSYTDNLKAYREIVAITEPYCDLYLSETMTTSDEAKAAATAGVASGKPVWVSWTLSPGTGTLRGGESIKAAFKTIEHLPVEAFLFNCADCNTVTRALAALKGLTDKPIGAYCNPVLNEPQENSEPEYIISNLLTADEYTQVAHGWKKAGATIIGGCCDTNPDYIRRLADTL